MHGTRYQIELASWPPPKKISGSDLKTTMCGVYDLDQASARLAKPLVAVYQLREDEDYERIKKACDGYKMKRMFAQ